jgi:hypothetical protein
MSDYSNNFGNGNGNGAGNGNGQGQGQGQNHGQGDHQSRVHRNAPSYNQSYSPYAYPPIDPMLRQQSQASISTMQPPSMHSHGPRHQAQHISPSLMFTNAAETTHSDSNSAYPTPSGSNLPLAPTPGRPTSSFAFSPSTFKTQGEFSWLDSILEGNGNNLNGGGDFLGDSSSLFTTQYPSEQAHLLSLESPEHLLASGSGFGGGLGGPGSMLPPMRREPQLEDVTSWANISHYISLFLQYLYPLLPLVHRPTFAEHLATRRDLRDTDFRALLLSIGKCACLLSRSLLTYSDVCDIATTHQPISKRAIRYRGPKAPATPLSSYMQSTSADILWPNKLDSSHYYRLVSSTSLRPVRADPQ